MTVTLRVNKDGKMFIIKTGVYLIEETGFKFVKQFKEDAIELDNSFEKLEDDEIWELLTSQFTTCISVYTEDNEECNAITSEISGIRTSKHTFGEPTEWRGDDATFIFLNYFLRIGM